MNVIENLLSRQTLEAFSWTLLHSLWQGMLVAIILAVLLVIFRMQSARFRYLLSVLGLMLVVAMASATFAFYYQASSQNTGILYVTNAGLYPKPGEVAAAGNAISILDNYSLTFLQYVKKHNPVIVLIWFFGMSIMLLRLLGGMVYVQRLKQYKVKAVPENWQKTMAALCSKLQIRKHIKLVESAFVQTPMVIGYFKPIVLLPIGTITGLSASQVEAILAHELAHIARKDYFVNMFQLVVEVILFYHPAIWWINSCIRIERENCCDDKAIALCGDPVTFAHALANLEEIKMQTPQLALAFAGNRNSLLKRIQRLVQKPTVSRSDYILPVIFLIIGIMAFSVNGMAKLNPDTECADVPACIEETETTSHSNIKMIIPGNFNYDERYYNLQDTPSTEPVVVVVKNKKGKITDMYVNGKKVRNKDLPAFRKLIENKMPQPDKKEKLAKQEKQEALKIVSEAFNDSKNKKTYSYSYNYNSNGNGDLQISPIPPVPPMPPMPEIAPIPPIPPIPPMAPFNGNKSDKKQYEQELKAYEKEKAAFHEQIKAYEREMEQFSSKSKSAHEKEVERYKRDIAHYKADVQRHERDLARLQEEKARFEAEHSRTSAIKAKHTYSITSDLLKEQLVKDNLIEKNSKEFKFILNEEGVFVNGEKLTEEQYKKYKKLLHVEDSNGNFYFKWTEKP